MNYFNSLLTLYIPTRLVMIACITGIAFSTAHADEDWLQWGGPKRDFTIINKDLGLKLERWNISEVWSRKLGTGNSGLVIQGNFLITQSRRIDRQNKISTKESIICFDKDSGDVIWEFKYDSFPIDGQEQYGGGEGPHSTPCIIKDKVFALGYAGQVHCLDLKSGDLIWSSDLVNDHNAEPVQFGFSASPLAYEDSIIFQAAGKTSGLIAFNQLDGEVLWKSPASVFSYASPFLCKIDGQTQIIFQSGNDVQGVNPVSGKQLWQFPLRRKGLTNVPTPLRIEPNRIIISGQGVNGSQAIEVGSTEENPFEASSVWRSTRVSIFETNTIQVGNLIIGGDSFLYGIDIQSGERLWSERGLGKSNILKINNKALLLTRAGDLIYAKPSTNGIEETHRFKLFTGESWTAPIIHQERLYARNRYLITCLDLNNSVSKILNEKRPLTIRELRLGLQDTSQKDQWNKIINKLNNDLDSLTFDPTPELIEWVRSQTETESDEIQTILQIIESQFQNDPNFVESLIALYLQLGLQDKVLDQLKKLRISQPQNSILKSISEDWNLTQQKDRKKFYLPRKDSARSITIAGSFNNWNPQSNYLRKMNDGWEIYLKLAPGEYEYKYVVDGQWILDPANKNQRKDNNGNSNSLIIIP